MAYKQIDLNTIVPNKYDSDSAGCYAKYWNIDENTGLIVTDGLTKLKYLKFIGVSLSPIFKVKNSDDYALFVVPLNTYRDANDYEAKFDAIENLCYKLERQNIAIRNIRVNDYENCPQFQDLIVFLKKHLKGDTIFSADCHRGNVLFCKITDTPILYDVVNFEWYEYHGKTKR